MAYQAIVNGARGLVFFGGHLTEVCTPDDAMAGWNWTFWRQVLRPVIHELSSSDLQPALLAPDSKVPVKQAAHLGVTDIELVGAPCRELPLRDRGQARGQAGARRLRRAARALNGRR